MTLIWISQEIVRFSTTGYDISMAVRDLRISSTVVDSLEYVSPKTWVLRRIFLGYRRGEPELTLSQFTGDPSLDREGNIYFVIHCFEDGKMIEVDIYVAYRKQVLHKQRRLKLSSA